MGQEITGSRFRKQDFEQFERRLEAETALLKQWFSEGGLSKLHGIGGFELEAWLIDRHGEPAPINELYLALLDDALYSPELSQFNIELNSTPLPVKGDVFSRMEKELRWNWGRCREVAGKLDADLMMIGILPTITDELLNLNYMSPMERYKALNEQVLRLRQGRPLLLEIHGEGEHLRTEHGDVMLEAATTSFQIHLQVEPERALRYYNAMQIISGPMVAITANSPLLFGRRLWQETRIPLFEQAVNVGGIAGAAFGPVRRVSFGTGYARRSVMETFQENLEHFPILLPANFDEPLESLAHLRLHNGTIWRWNRPLVGFDEDGTPHLRIEHRVIPSGPSIVDTIANTAFFYGLVHTLAEQSSPMEEQIPFADTRDNFYACARQGLNATLQWGGRHKIRVTELLAGELLPAATEGLAAMGIERDEAQYYLNIIAQRLASRQNGAKWQLDFLDRYGNDHNALVSAYRERQESGEPVHRWTL